MLLLMLWRSLVLIYSGLKQYADIKCVCYNWIYFKEQSFLPVEVKPQCRLVYSVRFSFQVKDHSPVAQRVFLNDL